jgi:uncharacterized protein YhfF
VIAVDVPQRYREFWEAFAQSQDVDPTPRFVEAFHFDDNERSANELAALVVIGRKQATAALGWVHEAEGMRVPQPGDLGIVTDFAGNEACVIQTTRVDIVPFCDVSLEFAATEGEGDGSLDYWRRVHEAFFARECERIGRTPEPAMPVICERFDVVWVTTLAATRRIVTPHPQHLVKIDPIRKLALSLEAVTEEPHHDYSSFRVRGKIFVTIPPGGDFIHVFVGEEERERALALYPAFVEKLLWGGKAVGLRVALTAATPTAVKSLVVKAYETRVQKDAKPKSAASKSRTVMAKPGQEGEA